VTVGRSGVPAAVDGTDEGVSDKADDGLPKAAGDVTPDDGSDNTIEGAVEGESEDVEVGNC
jgi:hypothetical protein